MITWRVSIQRREIRYNKYEFIIPAQDLFLQHVFIVLEGAVKIVTLTTRVEINKIHK